MIVRIVLKKKDGVLLYKAASKLLIALLVVSFLAVLLPVSPVHASTTTSTVIDSSSSDGRIYNAAASSWLERINGVNGVVDDTGTTITVGPVADTNALNRGFPVFNLTSIPIGATITEATLSVYLTAYNFASGSASGTNITLQSGMPTYPHISLNAYDYNKDNYAATSLGTNIATSISGTGYWNITLNYDGITALNTAIADDELFKPIMRTSYDITGSIIVEGYITFYSQEQGTDYAPKLYVTYTYGDYLYTFNGVYDENIGTGTLFGASNITAYFNDGTSPLTFKVNGTRMYAASTKPQYFYYDIWEYSNTSDTALHREYWLGADEDSGNYTIYGNQQGLENIVFTIRALGGAGLGSYVTVQRNIDGTLRTVEKRPVDSTGTVVMSLQAYTLYSVSIEGTEPNTSITFGNINTYTTPIILTVSALSFPSTTLQQYKYLRIWASRPTSTEIMVNYADTNLQTVSVYYEISDANGTVHYNFTHTGENSFSDIWTSALANTTYYLDATVVQSVFGTTTFKQILAKDGTTNSPIDLSFLGTWEFSIYGVTVSLDSTQIFWALVVLIIFGSFSVLNAYMGVFAGVAAAAIFVGLGWLDIPAGTVALAFAFTVAIAIAVYKRRGN